MIFGKLYVVIGFKFTTYFEFCGSPTWTRTRDLRINSPSLYRLSYQGTEKKIICFAAILVNCSANNYSTLAIAAITLSMFLLFRAATQMRPVSTA